MKKTYPPRMHTAEHILNQTMVRMFDCGRSFSAHVEKKKSKCDYHFDRALTEAEEGEIVLRINQVIDKGLPVTEEFMNIDRARAGFDLGKLPDGTADDIRIVRVGDYDAYPCIGPHVENTSTIGAFRLVSTSYSDGRLRVRFKLDRPKGT